MKPVHFIRARAVSLLRPSRQTSQSRKTAAPKIKSEADLRDYALFRRQACHFLPGGRIGNAQPQRRHDRGKQRETGKRIKAAGEATAVILCPADHAWAEETAEIADRIDPGDSGCCGGPGQNHWRHGPKRALRAVETNRGD